MRKLWRWLVSLRLAVILLILIAAAALVGTLFPQLDSETLRDPAAQARWLALAGERYGVLTATFHRLGLFTVYRSWWFLALAIALLLNMLACTLDRLGALLRVLRRPARVVMPERFYVLPNADRPARSAWHAAWPVDEPERAAHAVANALVHSHLQVRREPGEQAIYLHGERFRWAGIGTLFTHIGLLLLAIGVLISVWFSWRETTPPLVSGSRFDPGHGLAFHLRTNHLLISRYPDGRPRNYQADLTAVRDGRDVVSQEVHVGSPLSYHGVAFHLYSFGPAVRVRAVDEDGQPLRMTAANRETPDEPVSGELVLPLVGGYGELALPDYGVVLRIGRAYAGAPLFVQAVIGGKHTLPLGQVAPGQEVALDRIRLRFDPDNYLTLQVVHDPGFGPVIAAACLLILGLVLSFYFPHREVWGRIGDGRLVLRGRVEGPAADFEPLWDRVEVLLSESGG
ncbi:MAG TPA: hypothetical protein EYP04_10995 [Anaerolineae bacterium]|nr:hypothetical protein [Anaerolineae bacterium]HIQ05891.1 hypothetical protein [Anaerolineae bacterium]